MSLASGEGVDTVPVSGSADVEQAVRNPHDAFSACWQTSAARRREIVHDAARHVRERIGDLARLLTGEQGKQVRDPGPAGAHDAGRKGR